MPVFLMLAIFLIFMIRTAVISMALHGAISKTVRQSASAWYPVSLVLEQARSSEINQQSERWNEKWLKAGEAVRDYGKWLPSPVKEWAMQASGGSLSLEEGAGKLVFGSIVKQFEDEHVLDSSRLRIADVELPDQQDRSKAYLTIRAEYELPYRVPFLGHKIVLSESVRERAWIGGAPSESLLANSDNESLTVSFVSLTPNPVKPGRKATLVIRTKPGTTVDLSIIYKSGASEAKHLGSGTADASGLISWTWHVSGRTTPGEWNWQVSNVNGQSFRQAFQVIGKDGSLGGGS
jgi:hypothetical protein